MKNYILLLIIPFLSFGQKLSNEQKELKCATGFSINWDLKEHRENPPLKFIEECYKMIKIESGLVEWGWIYTVQNMSRYDRSVMVRFQLVDKDGFVISEKEKIQPVPAGQIMDIQSTATFSVKDLMRVHDTNWRVEQEIIKY